MEGRPSTKSRVRYSVVHNGRASRSDASLKLSSRTSTNRPLSSADSILSSPDISRSISARSALSDISPLSSCSSLSSHDSLLSMNSSPLSSCSSSMSDDSQYAVSSFLDVDSSPVISPLSSAADLPSPKEPNFRTCQSTNDDVIKPFWNDICARYSEILPIHSETGPDLPPIIYRTNKSWNDSFNSKPRIYPNNPSTVGINASSLSDLPIKKLPDSVGESTRAEVFRMKLSVQMRTVYKRWMNLSRHVYNKAIDIFEVDRSAKVFDVRDTLKYGHFASDIEKCSFPIEAFTQTFCEAWRTVKGGGKIKHRECDDLTSTIYTDGIHDGVIYPINMVRELKKIIPLDASLKKTKAVAKQRAEIDKMINESRVKFGTVRRLVRITFNRRCGKFTVQIPVAAEKVEQEQPKRDQVVAIDPGIRSLVTFYSEHWHGYLGEDWYRRTKGLQLKADRLAAEAAKCDKFYTKYRLRKRAAIINAKVTNRMKDMQHKIAIFLVKNFQIILLPELEARSLVRANRDKPAVSRAIMTSSPYQFKQIMIQKAEKYSANLILCKEYYTSVTCTKCGFANKSIAGKTFNCSRCKYKVDRDYNGARNIMLKHLSLRGDGPSTIRKKVVRPKLALKKQVVQ